MDTHRIHRVTELAVAATVAAVVLLGGCATGTDGAGTDGTGTEQSATFFGPPQQLGNGTVKTYATLDTTGHPTEVGLRLSASALDGLPPNDTPLAQPLELALPAQAAQTVFDHVMLNWNPHGHDPVALFGKPHFDFHFAMVDQAAMRAIDPADPTYSARAAHLPEGRYIPQDYVIPPDAPAVPGMGVHWVDSTDTTLVPGTYHFTQIVLNGTWAVPTPSSSR